MTKGAGEGGDFSGKDYKDTKQDKRATEGDTGWVEWSGRLF